MRKYSVKNIKNKAADSSGDELRKRVKCAVKTVAVPSELKSKVLNLLRKCL